MENLKIEDLKENLDLGEYGEQIADYNNGDIDDVIQEIANNNIDCYNFDLLQWVGNNIDNAYYCEQAIEEFGNGLGFFEIIKHGQHIAATTTLYENIDDILKYYAYNYIEKYLKIEEITKEENEEIEEIRYTVLNRLEDIDEIINEIFEESEE